MTSSTIQPAAAPLPHAAVAAHRRSASRDDDTDRHDAILDAALRAATEGGFDAVQMRTVAETARVAVGTLYGHYPSKTHLLVAVLRREFERIASDCHWSAGDRTPEQRLAVLTSRLHAEWQRDPRLTEATTRALVAADTAAAAAVTQTAGVVQQLFAYALGGATATQCQRDTAGLITDVWLANLCAFSSSRITAVQARERIDRGIVLLMRRFEKLSKPTVS